MFEEEKIKIYAVTTKKVIKRLEDIENIAILDLNNTILEAFDGYDVDGEDELIGSDNWPNFSSNSEYKLNIKVNHENAYEFTIFVKTDDTKASVVNVL